MTASMNGRIGHQATFADLVAPGLELRLHQRDDIRVGRRNGGSGGKDVAQRDERDVDA